MVFTQINRIDANIRLSFFFFEDFVDDCIFLYSWSIETAASSFWDEDDEDDASWNVFVEKVFPSKIKVLLEEVSFFCKKLFLKKSILRKKLSLEKQVFFIFFSLVKVFQSRVLRQVLLFCYISLQILKDVVKDCYNSIRENSLRILVF